MLDLLEAIDARQANRIRVLASPVFGPVLVLAIEHLTSAFNDRMDLDWYPTAYALLSIDKVPLSAKLDLMADACSSGCVSVVRACIEAGCPINTDFGEKTMPRWKGQSPLMVAAARDHADLVSFLIAKGAEVNFQSTDGNSPLLAAVYEESCDACRLLLAAGASLHLPNQKDSPLHHLISGIQMRCSTVSGLEMSKILIDAGLSLSEKNPSSGASVAERMNGNRSTEKWPPELWAYEQARLLAKEAPEVTAYRPPPRL